MSFEEYDALEIAQDLQANRELGRSDFSEPLVEEYSGLRHPQVQPVSTSSISFCRLYRGSRLVFR